jgi:hypothetical protein
MYRWQAFVNKSRQLNRVADPDPVPHGSAFILGRWIQIRNSVKLDPDTHFIKVKIHEL